MPAGTPETGPVWSADALARDPHADAQKARKVQSMFAAIAAKYDLNNRLHSFWQDQRWRRQAVGMAGIGPETDVLDVACGTGDLSEAFADARPRSVTGVDFTPEMLDVARRKAAPGPAGRPEVRYETGDAMQLRFADASFDVVSIAFGIRNVADPMRALREFHRVLRPGGRLVVLEFADPTNPLVRFGSDLYTKRIMPWTASLIAGDRSGAYHYLPRSVSTFMQPQAFRRSLQDAGFAPQAAQPLTFGICVAHLAAKPGPDGAPAACGGRCGCC